MSHRSSLKIASRIIATFMILSAQAYGQASFTDSFDGTTLNPFWVATQQFGTITLSTDQNHTPGGSQALKLASTVGGDRKINLTHQFSTPTTGNFSVWFYDVSPGQQTLYEQLSLSNSQTADSVSVGTMDFDAFCYEAQVYNSNTQVEQGPNQTCGIYPQLSTTNVTRTAGWHKFDINVTANQLSILIDGSTVFSTAGSYSFDSVQLLTSGPSSRPDTASYWDDFSFGPSSFTDSFDGTTLNPFWVATQQFGTITLSTDQNHTPGGSQALKLASTVGGDRKINLTHQFSTPTTSNFSVWFYDVSPGQQTLYEQLSLSNSQTADSVSVGTMDFDAFCYEAQVYNSNTQVEQGPNQTCGIYPQLSTTNVTRTAGWHKFDINVTANQLSILIDGSTVFSTAGSYSFDSVQLLTSGPSSRPDTASYWDDFSWPKATPSTCTTSLSPTGSSYGAQGGIGSFSVTAAPTCTWNATPNANWISILPQTSTQTSGSSAITFAVAPNTGGARAGAISVIGSNYNIDQAGLSCTFLLSPSNVVLSSGGGLSSFAVVAPGGCSWTANSNIAWIRVISGASGTGSGRVQILASANSGLSRTGTLTIAGQVVTVRQSAPSPSGGSGPDACGATDVSSKLFVSQGQARVWPPVYTLYHQDIKITNTSVAVVNGPLYYVLVGLHAGISPSPGQELTHCFSSNGDYIVNLQSPGIAPGKALTFGLDFVDEQQLPINYQPKVLSGKPSK